MIEALKRAFETTVLGNLIGVVGLIVSIIGFIFTIVSLIRGKRAAIAAFDAAKQTRLQILSIDAVVECTQVLNLLEEVRRLYRAGAYDIIPDRVLAGKRSLITIKASLPQLSDQHQIVLQNAISQLVICEELMESFLDSKVGGIDLSKMPRIISSLSDSLVEFLVVVKSLVEE